MKKQRKIRNVFLALTLLGIALMLAGLVMPAGFLPEQLKTILGYVVVVGTVTCMSFACYSIKVVEACERLQAGDGLLAKWVIDPQMWQAFLAQHASTKRERGDPKPKFKYHKMKVPSGGIEVFIGEKDLLVGDAYVRLPRHGDYVEYEQVALEQGQPSYLEVTIWQYGPGRVKWHALLRTFRIPVPDAALPDVENAIAYMQVIERQQAIAWQMGTVRVLRVICLLAMALTILAGLIVFGVLTLLDVLAGKDRSSFGTPWLLIFNCFLLLYLSSDAFMRWEHKQHAEDMEV